MTFVKGQSGNPAGRPKGPSEQVKKVREAIALIANDMSDDFRSWLLLTASGDEERGLKPDPKGAADLYLKAIEYHIPKLSRVEGQHSVTVETHEDFLERIGRESADSSAR